MKRIAKWKFLLIYLLITFSLLLPITQIEFSEGLTSTHTLYYGDYYYIYWTANHGPPSYISWSFSSRNTYVGIEVWVFEDANFALFDNGHSAEGYQLSNGGYYYDSGQFTLPFED